MKQRRILQRLGVLALVAALSGCGDSVGPGIAVALNLHSIDGVFLPAQLRTPGGNLVTVAGGKLQGTNWGHACGVALRLVEGPITAAGVPDCKLTPGQEKTLTLSLADSRFPVGAHEYHFVP